MLSKRGVKNIILVEDGEVNKKSRIRHGVEGVRRARGEFFWVFSESFSFSVSYCPEEEPSALEFFLAAAACFAVGFFLFLRMALCCWMKD